MKYSGELTMAGNIEALDVRFVPHNGTSEAGPAPFVPGLRVLRDLDNLGEYGSRTVRVSIEVEIEEEEYE